MSSSYSSRHQQRIDAMIAHLPKGDGEPKGKQREVLTRFMQHYFAHLPEAELEALDEKVACMRAKNDWDFIQSRSEPGRGKVRIFQPELREHGWRSPNYIVQTINDDMPFLVDSLTSELNRQGFEIYSCIHPILRVKRSDKGALKDFAAVDVGKAPQEGYHDESLINFEISIPGEQADVERLEKDLNTLLEVVRRCVIDWPKMVDKVEATIKGLSDIPATVDIDELAEAIDFIHWLKDGHFVFLGAIEYDYVKKGGDYEPVPVDGSALGLFAADIAAGATQMGIEKLPREVQSFLLKPTLIQITKSNRVSRVHRSVHMDYVGVKRYNSKGEVIGEQRFLGLFTSTVYFRMVSRIPLLRRKVQAVLQRSNFTETGHDGKALAAILEQLPRDEMFQMSEEELFDIAMGVLALEARPQPRIFVRKDVFERFVSCFVFIPRRRFNTELRYRIQEILEDAYQAQVETYYTQLTDSPLARVHLKLTTTPGAIPEVNLERVNEQIEEVVNDWQDGFRRALRKKYGENHGEKVFRHYGKAFPETYTNRYGVNRALKDIDKIDQAFRHGQIALELMDGEEWGGPEDFELRLYVPGTRLPLSDLLPMLENMGLQVMEEFPSHVTPMGHEDGLWIRHFHIRMANKGLKGGEKPDIAKVRALFEEALERVWCGVMQNDAFNRLIMTARLPWRDVMMLRAYAKYMKQIRFTYGQEVIEEALARHPHIATLLVTLFYARFNPANTDHDSGREKAVMVELEHALAKVSNVTHDRVFNRYAQLIQATWRTNFFQKTEEGKPKDYMSFKLNPEMVPDLPKPRPYAEIFVYSQRVEGVHLRGGKVARGGLRWSDRHEDYRTEVLGLMKAQMVKNAVIVPEGAKGGFVVKQPPESGDRQELMEEAVYCYITYLSGLLDITDNIVSGNVSAPVDVVCHDGDDPYLVVAADKGTATFSDIANGVSESYGFWLGDAFASGGSAGYDHKKMGITAKGGWVSVKRHFMEMGKDIQKEDFTAVGIGDMSGDVFGNGMLLSPHTKLVAAFNHLHIFIDPNPAPEASFKERQRLFALPRSSWADYDADLISKGGGVFERSAKSIKLTSQMRKLLDTDAKTATPDELISMILKAPVELLWNGGIGTYVKAQSESHEEVGDRANDALRVNGRDLRCKVVGEGGNLGLTQRGRIEYAMNGGRINTDAIDNSAGVDCSDHEVNIKIALAAAVEKKKLSGEARDALLADMTDNVETLVLRDNILQTQALTNAEIQGTAMLDSQARVMRMLERIGLLDRAIEFLPSDEEMENRKLMGTGLTRPELAVLLSYSKLELYRDLLSSAVPDDDYFEADLKRYFPKAMQDDFGSVIVTHPLRREIIATVVTNSIINRIGSTFFYQVEQDTGVKACDIVRSYIVARDSFGLRDLWQAIEDSQRHVPVETQVSMNLAINQLVYRTTLWFLRNAPQPLNITDLVKTYRKPIAKMRDYLSDILRDDTKNSYDQDYKALTKQGVSKALAQQIALLPAQAAACDIVTVANKTGIPLRLVGEIYFELSARLKLGWLRQSAYALDENGYWSRQAATAIISDLFDQQRRLTAEVIRNGCDGEKCDLAVSSWMEAHSTSIDRYMHFIEDLTNNKEVDFSMLVVALRKLEGICAV